MYLSPSYIFPDGRVQYMKSIFLMLLEKAQWNTTEAHFSVSRGKVCMIFVGVPKPTTACSGVILKMPELNPPPCAEGCWVQVSFKSSELGGWYLYGGTLLCYNAHTWHHQKLKGHEYSHKGTTWSFTASAPASKNGAKRGGKGGKSFVLDKSCVKFISTILTFIANGLLKRSYLFFKE